MERDPPYHQVRYVAPDIEITLRPAQLRHLRPGRNWRILLHDGMTPWTETPDLPPVRCGTFQPDPGDEPSVVRADTNKHERIQYTRNGHNTNSTELHRTEHRTKHGDRTCNTVHTRSGPRRRQQKRPTQTQHKTRSSTPTGKNGEHAQEHRESRASKEAGCQAVHEHHVSEKGERKGAEEMGRSEKSAI